MNAQRKIAYVVRIDQEIQKKKINRLYKKGHQRLLNWIHKFRPTFKYIDMQTLQTHTRTQLFTSLLTNIKDH